MIFRCVSAEKHYFYVEEPRSPFTACRAEGYFYLINTPRIAVKKDVRP